MLAKLFFILSFGYAKIPGQMMPFGAIIFASDLPRIRRLIEDKMSLIMVALSILFVVYVYILLYFSGSGWSKEYENIFSISYKLLIAPYLALLLSDLILKKDNFLHYFITFQCLLIFFASFSEDIFETLLLFQTDGAIEVFSEIFGVRSVGFGLFHNEGVIAILLLYMINVTYNNKSLLYIDLLIYLSSFMSRLILFVLPFYQIYRGGYRFIFPFLVIIVAVPYFFDVSQGPASEVYEIYNNYINGNGFYLRNMDHIQTMITIPSSFETWFYGDRMFFNIDGSFYKDTDIGILRIVYFGGLPLLFLYTMINFLPLWFVKANAPKNIVIFIIGTIILANFKGLAPHSWAALALYHCYRPDRLLQPMPMKAVPVRLARHEI